MEELKCNEGLAKPSSHVSELTTEVNVVENSSVLCSHYTIFVGNMEVPISRIGMRLITKMGYKGGGLGLNGQGMTHSLEVVRRPRFVCLGYNEGKCSKVS